MIRNKSSVEHSLAKIHDICVADKLVIAGLAHKRCLYLDYDYSIPGAYYVTMVTKDRINLFGEINGEMMKLSVYGEIRQRLWGELPLRYGNINLDYSMVMPNPFHGTFVVNDASGRGNGMPYRK